MSIEHLVKMASHDIEDFFRTEPERADAVAGVANHLQRFWDPRMRRRPHELCQRGWRRVWMSWSAPAVATLQPHCTGAGSLAQDHTLPESAGSSRRGAVSA